MAVGIVGPVGVESTWADDVPCRDSACVDDGWVDVTAWLELDECELLEWLLEWLAEWVRAVAANDSATSAVPRMM